MFWRRNREVRREGDRTVIRINMETPEAALKRLRELTKNPGPLYAFRDVTEVSINGAKHRMVISGRHLVQPTTVIIENAVFVGERLPAVEYVAAMLRLLRATRLTQEETVQRISTPKPSVNPGDGWKSDYNMKDLV